MKKSYCLLLIGILVFSFHAIAQDKIYKKGGDVIEVKVIEVGTAEVKYHIFNDQGGPMYTLDKSRIIKVVYENGRTETFSPNLKNPALYADQAKTGLKFNFLAPLFGYTQINLEHNLRPGKSYELALGLIGLGKRQKLWFDEDTYRKAAGAFLGAGYKFSKIPDFINNTERYSHVLQGIYAKPEIVFGVYGQNLEDFSNGEPVYKTTVFGGFLLNFGKQWVLGDSFLIDMYFGLGYAFDNIINEDFSMPRSHFALVGGGDSGVGSTAGLKIGVLLDKKKH